MKWYMREIRDTGNQFLVSGPLSLTRQDYFHQSLVDQDLNYQLTYAIYFHAPACNN